jgi:hypothetical protein
MLGLLRRAEGLEAEKQKHLADLFWYQHRFRNYHISRRDQRYYVPVEIIPAKPNAFPGSV